MGVSVAAAVAMALLSQRAELEAGETILRSPSQAIATISEAMALQAACPALTLDPARIADALTRSGIRFEALVPEIRAQGPYHRLGLSLLGIEKACRLALSLYGPEGSRGAGFLARR